MIILEHREDNFPSKLLRFQTFEKMKLKKINNLIFVVD